MQIKEPTFTIGVEEEYLLVDRETRNLATQQPKSLLQKCEEVLKNQVSPEFLQSQIEIGTKICKNIKEVREQICYLRKNIAEISNHYNLAPIASSTHPFAHWTEQHHTNKERYNLLAQDLQLVARRMIISGMHVHIGIEDDELRIDILNQAKYFLPHLLALSTSSPFWQGKNTGLKSYRLSIFDELPRTGLPPNFQSYSEYTRTISVLKQANIIEDASKVWWDLRPSTRFPTVEMRISDMCPLVEDCITIAALFLCICRMLYRLRVNNQRWRLYPIFLLNENRWRAQRHGITEGLIDFGKGEVIEFKQLLEELLYLIKEDAEYFECQTELNRAEEILKQGTSAERQLMIYNNSLEEGLTEKQALIKIVDSLMEETLTGI